MNSTADADRYAIRFGGWNRELPDNANLCAWDYVPSIDPSATYQSSCAAKSALRAAYLGPDVDGVAPILYVEQVTQ